MSKKFTYTKITGHYYCQHSDDWEQDGIDFDYEVQDRDLLPEVVALVFKDYFGDIGFNEGDIKEGLAKMIEEQDLLDQLADNYEDTLKEIFKDEAMDWYNG